MPDAVAEIWKEIWAQDNVLKRSYIYDFELYGKKFQNKDLPEVELFIGVKS